MKHIHIGDIEFDIETHEANDRWISHAIRRDKMWAPNETREVIDMLKPYQTFIDIGANIGWFTLLASRIVGDTGRVIAYEPDPRNYEMLSRNIQRNGMTNVTAYEMAIDTQRGEGTLYRSAINQGDHRLFDADASEEREKVKVRTANPSRTLTLHGIKADMIKCDTQGYELRVFTALADYIKSLGTLPTLILEYWPNGIKAAGGCPLDLIRLLGSMGYDFRTWAPMADMTASMLADGNFEAHMNLVVKPKR